MSRNLTLFMVIVLLMITGITITAWMRTDHKQKDVKPLIKNITIGVIPGNEASFSSYHFISTIAQDDINSYCNTKGLHYRFNFNLSPPVLTPEILTQTKDYRTAGVNMILGYPWSSHLCSGARAYGYNKTMVLLTPSASSSVYALRNTTMYHLCVLEFEPIETTLKAMWDRGVRAYILLCSYESSENLVSMIRGKTGTPHFDYNITMPYSIRSPLDKFMKEADEAVREMITKYGVEHTAVLWFRVDPMVYDKSPSEDPFLISVASQPNLSSVIWYTYEEGLRIQAIPKSNVGSTASKLKLFTVEQTPLINPTYNRINELWRDTMKLSTDMGYYIAVAYDGFWVLSLSAIEANSTDPLNIFKVFPSVAANYTGASGRCTMGDYSSRLGADYNISAYFEVDDRIQSLQCGSYDWEKDVFTWNMNLIN